MLNFKSKRKQAGFTLAELMITVGVSAVVLSGVMGLFFSMSKHSRTSLESNRLDRELHSVMSIVAKDVRRAGFWGNAQSGQANPFMGPGVDLAIGGTNSDCILLSYDKNGDGTLPAIATNIDDERYGYRLQNFVIQFRPAGKPYDCTTAATNWEDLTDFKSLLITQFEFQLLKDDVDLDGAGPGTASTSIRRVKVTISGKLTSDPTVTKTITRTIRVYNDKYNPAP